ncbi:MAG: hypothetical protein RLY31_426 [Bacteroidota bacterium]
MMVNWIVVNVCQQVPKFELTINTDSFEPLLQKTSSPFVLFIKRQRIGLEKSFKLVFQKIVLTHLPF